MLVHRNTTFDF